MMNESECLEVTVTERELRPIETPSHPLPIHHDDDMADLLVHTVR